MKTRNGLLIMMAWLISACAGSPERHNYVGDYLDELDKRGLAGDRVDVEALPARVRTFHDFLDDFSLERVRDDALSVYAEDAFLNDTLKTLRGNEAIRDYFVGTFDHVTSLEADVLEVTGSGNSWYYRWNMTLSFEDLNDGKPITSVGVSHIVFDEEGRVAIHQDYWDAATHFFTLVPLAGKVIDKVKDDL